MMLSEVKEFLDSSTHNEWLRIGNIEVYVRKSLRVDPRTNLTIRCFDIANVSCIPMGQGEFTRFLDELMTFMNTRFQAIFIEQVQNRAFAEYFRKRRAYERNDFSGTPSFFIFGDSHD